jgi:hypothetical protein
MIRSRAISPQAIEIGNLALHIAESLRVDLIGIELTKAESRMVGKSNADAAANGNGRL